VELTPAIGDDGVPPGRASSGRSSLWRWVRTITGYDSDLYSTSA
jgi:hypothetical protein